MKAALGVRTVRKCRKISWRRWSRVQQQTAATDGKTAQITYEQIAAVCGDDVSTWGARMQFESDGAWKVYAVTVGQSK